MNTGMQVLAMIDVSAISKGIEFCDELGYEIMPVRMIKVQDNLDAEMELLHWIKYEITLTDVSKRNNDGIHHCQR